MYTDTPMVLTIYLVVITDTYKISIVTNTLNNT